MHNTTTIVFTCVLAHTIDKHAAQAERFTNKE